MGFLAGVFMKKINEAQIKKVVSEIFETYFHGTSSYNAGSLHKNGLNSGSAIKNVGGSNSGDFSSASGRSYITKNQANAVRYGMMSKHPDGYGHVFEFEPDENVEFGIDEDEMGSFLCSYFNGKVKNLPFRTNLLDNLSAQEKHLIKQGDFRGFTSCKKIIDKLSRNEIKNLSSYIRDNGLPYFQNATTTANLKHTKHYRFKQPSEDEFDDMTNFLKYGDKGIMNNLNNYYLKNREEVNYF